MVITGVREVERTREKADACSLVVSLGGDGPGISAVVASLTKSGAKLVSCERARPSLDEVFAHFTEAS